MNDYRFLPRHASAFLDKAIQMSPVVVLMGARQTGKSTLVQEETFAGEARRYITLDDLETRERAERAPDALLKSAPFLTIDEVQRSPDLIFAIKRAVDRDRPRRPGRFLLTGSANLLLMERISESLAGRASYLTLWPFTQAEKHGRGRAGRWSELFAAPLDAWPDLMADLRADGSADAALWHAEARRGGYPIPALALDTPEARELWLDGYVRTYLERDLQRLASIDNLIDFRRLMRAACLRLGNVMNQAELGRDVQIPRPTVHRYFNLLETSYQLVRLPPYSVNRTKRLVKSPKLFWSDPALALHLAGQDEPTGASFENLVLTDLLAWRDAQAPRPEILFWRTSTGLEVDFVIEHKGRLLPIEVKSTANPGWNDTKGLRAFLEEYPDLAPGGLLLNAGEAIEWMADGVLAVPWWRVLDG